MLQRPRLGAYLEQSTRYIPYDAPIPGGGYRYYRDASLGPAYETAMDEVFGIYSAALPRVQAWAVGEFAPAASPRPRTPVRARRRRSTCCAGCCPRPRCRTSGIFATGQTYEQLVLHLLAHPLPEARHYGRMILDTLQQVMPSFVSRVERPDRGGEWVTFLEERRRPPDGAGLRAWASTASPARIPKTAESVRLLHVDGDEDALLAALLFEAAGAPEEVTRTRLAALSGDERRECSPTSWVTAATAAIVPAGGWRRCATASRSSATTARSATSSAIAC